MHKEYLSYDTIHKQTNELAHQVVSSGWNPTLIVGICRGGLLPATLMSHALKVPMKAFNLSLRDQTMFFPDSADWIPQLTHASARVLVVDDINDSGSTVAWIKQDWGVRFANSGCVGAFTDHFRFATLLNKASSTQQVNYSAQQVPQDQSHVWWVFPWEV